MISRDERREYASDANYAGRQTAKWVVLAVIFALVLGGVVWGVTVATSGPKGRGDAYASKNAAANWVKQQAEFNRRYQSIKAQDKNIDVAAAAVVRDPENQRRQIELDGLQRNCISASGEYNSLAREYLAEQFRDADLPASLPDPEDLAATDCAPTKTQEK